MLIMVVTEDALEGMTMETLEEEKGEKVVVGTMRVIKVGMMVKINLDPF